MASTALVIGLGTSGLHIIEECQQFYYQFTGKNKPDTVRYLYLETDVNQTAEATAMGKTDIIPVYIGLQQIGANIQTLLNDSRLDHSWIPPVDSALAVGNGAGGNSAYGRLALWINYAAVRAAILQNWQQIQGDSNTYVFIVGTLTGGTGSGTCVDMAYLVRNITNSDNVFGLFLTPSRQQLAQGGSDALFYNYFSAISAIQYYSEENHPFEVIWPDGSKYRNNANPYKQCYFISQDYTKHLAPMHSVSQLYKVAGLHVFSRILSFGEVNKQTGLPVPNFSETINRRLLDIQSNVNGYKFSTFGTKLIYYPKELLKEMFGLKLSKQILNQWSNPQQYIDAHGSQVMIVANQTQIKGIIKGEFEQQIIDCLNIVDGQVTASGNNLLEEIKTTNINALVSKNYQEPNANAYVYRLFATGNNANYYALIINNQITIRDQFIDRIYDLLETAMEKYQNLTVGRLVLDTIVESIESVLKFWKDEYDIDGQAANWNTLLQRKIGRIMDRKTLPTLLVHRKAYFREQLVNVLMLNKMQVAVEVLKNIVATIQTAQVPLRSQNHELPTIPKIQRLLDLVIGVVNVSSTKVDTVTLERRENKIRSNLTTDTPNFSAIFAKGSLDQDLQDLERSYNNDNQHNRFSPSHITNNMKIWSYLENIDHNKLYKDCIVRSIEYVNNSINYFQNQTIVRLIVNLSQTPGDKQWQTIAAFVTGNVSNILDAMPGLEQLRDNEDVFGEHKCLTLMYINSDINALRGLMKNYEVDIQNDTACELPELTDAVIVFQEYGYMGGNAPAFSPMVNIGINKTIRQRILENIVTDNNAVAVTPNMFVFKRRVPYLTKEVFEQYLNRQ